MYPDNTYRTICIGQEVFGQYVSRQLVSRIICIGQYVSDFMYRTLCIGQNVFGQYVSDNMYRTVCIFYWCICTNVAHEMIFTPDRHSLNSPQIVHYCPLVFTSIIANNSFLHTKQSLTTFHKSLLFQ